MSYHCLVCLAELDSSSSQKPSYNFPGSLNSSVLNDQLWSTFILTKVLQLPNWKFENILKSTSGIHPGNWFVLCDNCSKSIVNIAEIQAQIKTLQLKVDKLVKQVKDKFNSSLIENEPITKKNERVETIVFNDVSQEIRQFFKITRESSQTKVEINDDTETVQEIDNNWNWEPSNNFDHDDDDNLSTKSEDWKPTAKLKTNNKRKKNIGSLNRKRKKYNQVSEKDHSKGYYTPGSFQCNICPRKLKSQPLLDKHYKYHDYTKRKFNGKFDCTLCKAPCARLFHLKNHYQNVHKLRLTKNWDVNDEDNQRQNVIGHPVSDDLNIKMEIDTETGDNDEELLNISDDKMRKRPVKTAINPPSNVAETFQCPKCTHKYRNQSSLNKHLDYHKMTLTKYNGKFDCDKCGAPFARILHLTNHYRNVHQCTLDQGRFKGHYDDLLAEQNNFKCGEPQCQFSCKKEAGLKYHLKVKHKKNWKVNDLPVSNAPTPLVCELCGFTAKEGDYAKQQMQRHMLNHKIFDNSVNPSISTTDLICTLCNQLFKSRTDLRSHKVTVHTTELGLTSHQCSYCPRLFPNKQNLFHHEQRIHKKKGRFPCAHCDHEAMNPYRLGQHMAKHTKDRDICQYCSASYTKTGGQLREHIKRHHPDKYAPSTSRLKFGGVPMENNDLIEKKPKLRRFKCKYCCDSDGVVFDSQLAYTMHLEESHKDLYKFKCDLCGEGDGDKKKVYMSLTSLNYHKRIHHHEKGKEVRCGWCGTKVAHRFYLYGHRKNCKGRPEGAKGILAVEDNANN